MPLNPFSFEIRKLYKNKTNAIVSVLGLAIGLFVFIAGFIYLDSQWSYDKGFKDYRDIYRIETKGSDNNFSLLIPQPLSKIFKEKCPEIISLTKFYEIPIVQPLLKFSEDKSVYIEHLFNSDSSFFKIFDYPFVFGTSQTALLNPQSLVISKTVSDKLFGNKNPVGRTITIGQDENFTISGVFNNLAFPSHITPDAVRLINPQININDPWNELSVYTYIKINPNSSLKNFKSKLTGLYDDIMAGRPENLKIGNNVQKASIVIRPLEDIFLNTEITGNPFKKGNKTGLTLIFYIIIFVLVVSIINFTNLNLAETNSRMKEVAIRKYLGASVISIVRQLYLGVLIRCIIALLLAVLAITFLLPVISNITVVHLSITETGNLKIFPVLFLLLATTTLVGGSYPIIYMSLINIAKILKGNFSNIYSGKIIRNGLLVVQFVIINIFISGVLIIKNQISFLRNKDLGLNPEQVMVIYPGNIQTLFQYTSIKSRLQNLPGVNNISCASAVGIPNEQTVMGININGIKYQPQYICVDTGYLNIMEAHFISGRNFTKALDSGSSNSIIINSTMAQMTGITDLNKIGNVQVFGQTAQVIGIVADMNFYGFETKIPPMVFTTKPFTLTPFLLVKLSSDRIDKTLLNIQKEWKSIEPGYPLRYEFFDQSFQELYTSYERLEKIIRYITIFSIILALIGLFSFNSLIIIQRSKEITIRKVLGASPQNILVLLNTKFFRLLVLANLIALPLAILISQYWLNNFAFRIKNEASPYLIAALLSILLTVLIITLQSLRIVTKTSYRELSQ